MKKKIITLAALLAVLVSIALGIGMVASSASYAQAPTQPGQVAYDNMGDRLLSEFLIFHHEYFPQTIVQLCEDDEKWELIGIQDAQGFRWISAAVSSGIFMFGYIDASLQPQVISFIPISQPLIGNPGPKSFLLLVESAKEQFKRDPDIVTENMAVYRLTDDISAVIFFAPDGSYSVATGFNKFINLKDLEEA